MKPINIICGRCKHRRGNHQNPRAFLRLNVGKCLETNCICVSYKANWWPLFWFDYLYFALSGIFIGLMLSGVFVDQVTLIKLGFVVYILNIIFYVLVNRKYAILDADECGKR